MKRTRFCKQSCWMFSTNFWLYFSHQPSSLQCLSWKALLFIAKITSSWHQRSKGESIKVYDTSQFLRNRLRSSDVSVTNLWSKYVNNEGISWPLKHSNFYFLSIQLTVECRTSFKYFTFVVVPSQSVSIFSSSLNLSQNFFPRAITQPVSTTLKYKLKIALENELGMNSRVGYFEVYFYVYRFAAIRSVSFQFNCRCNCFCLSAAFNFLQISNFRFKISVIEFFFIFK